ncbi:MULTISPECIES: type II toxin-antitoxin system HicB family antitoxin [unclassified Microcoleus]|jgi:predicted RNase H-like HicB family nuclease|uniref:type II toxin-antitoxin system HicB family antitoxin n=1 Tax=unclassified Microcoleus TaxID=2642155 RepID=UPI002FD54BB8
MKSTQQFTAIIEREGDGYVSLCPELDIASQGDNIEEARRNLIEALELFFETADPSEVKNRLHSEFFVTRVEVSVG